MKTRHALWFAAFGRIAISVIAIAVAPTLAGAQSADLVLCDRLAADPADPDKPADVKGAPDVAPSDVATAIKYCKVASGSSRRALYQLGRAYAANKQNGGGHRRLAQGGRQGARLPPWSKSACSMERGPASPGTKPRRASCSSAPPKPAIHSASPISQRSPAAARRRIRKSKNRCWRKSSETNAEAQYQLGLMMADGTGESRSRLGFQPHSTSVSMNIHFLRTTANITR